MYSLKISSSVWAGLRILTLLLVLHLSSTLADTEAMQGLGVLPSNVCRRRTKKRVPHIVFVLTDDQGIADIGYNSDLLPEGVPPVYTPVLDRLASEGIKFTNLYQQATCSPTRAAILTGRYGLRSGVGGYYPYSNDARILPDARGLPVGEVSLATKLKKAGYATHYVGKWHLGMGSERALPVNRGFDSFVGHLGGQIDHFSKVFGVGGVFSSPRIQQFFVPEEERVTSYDWHREVRDSYGNLVVEMVHDQETHSSDFLTAEAVDIIRNHNKKQRLFLYLSYSAPHAPLQATPDDMESCAQGTAADFTNKTNRLIYCGMMHSVDRGLAQVESTLKLRGMWHDTVLIFASDNGGDLDFGASNGPYKGSKGTNYQGGILVPGFVRVGKRVKTVQGFTASSFAGKMLTAKRQHVDLHTMMLDMAGYPIQGGNILDGLRTQWEHILSNSLQRHEVLITAGYGNFPINPAKAIILGRYKFLVDVTIPFAPTSPPPGTEELYDLETDPFEANNLISDQSYSPIVQFCKERLAYWETQRLQEPEFAYFPSFLQVALTPAPQVPKPEVWGDVVNITLTGRCHLPESFSGHFDCSNLI